MSLGNIRIGSVILHQGSPYVVLTTQHVQMGRGGAVLRTKLRNVVNGKVLEETFREGDRIEEADLSRGKATFLYHDDSGSTFMDASSYDQFTLDDATLADQWKFLKEGQEVDVMRFEDKAITAELPKKVELTVKDTPPGVRGDTAQGSVMKEATLETGYVVKVPLFVKPGELIRINTETGEYVERV